MTTTIKAFAIAASVITVVVLREYNKKMEAINEKFQLKKDSTSQVMSHIAILSDSIKSNPKPQFVNDTGSPQDKLILNLTTK